MNIEINLLKTAKMMADREVLLQVCMEHGISEDDAFVKIHEEINGKLVHREGYYDAFLEQYNFYYDVLLRMSVDEAQIKKQTAEPTSSESEEQAQFDFPPTLQDAVDKLTIDTFNSLNCGDEVCLNDEYSVYHYSGDDIVVINRVKNDDGDDDWTEVLQVMTDGINFTFEAL